MESNTVSEPRDRLVDDTVAHQRNEVGPEIVELEGLGFALEQALADDVGTDHRPKQERERKLTFAGEVRADGVDVQPGPMGPVVDDRRGVDVDRGRGADDVGLGQHPCPIGGLDDLDRDVATQARGERGRDRQIGVMDDHSLDRANPRDRVHLGDGLCAGTDEAEDRCIGDREDIGRDR